MRERRTLAERALARRTGSPLDSIVIFEDYDDMKYLLYCRKSTDTEDKQVLSLESQENELLRIAEAQHLEVAEILKESMSAKAPGRPVFNKMMKAITTGKADAILCWKIDRLTRNPVDGGQIQWLLQNDKIKCIRTFEKNFFPNDNVLLMSIEQAMASQYIRDLSVNVKRGNRAKLERGEWPNHAPFGYLNDKATKTIKIDRKRAPYVVRAFELYATGGYTIQQITDVLYKEGLRTASGNKVMKNQVHRFFLNKFYCGFMQRDGKLYKGNHKGLVPLSLFNQAEDVLHGRNHPRPEKAFLFCERIYYLWLVRLCSHCRHSENVCLLLLHKRQRTLRGASEISALRSGGQASLWNVS